MIIIRNTLLCKDEGYRLIERNIRAQALTGLIVLPEYCELLHVDPGENKVEIRFVEMSYEGDGVNNGIL